MRPWMYFCRDGARFCAGCACSFLLWGLWTLLATALCFQIWLACSQELEVPKPLLRHLEKHLSKTGLGVRLGQVVFDPTGNLVVRDFALTSESLGEPVLRGRVLSTRVDPWGFLLGDPEAHQVEVSGVDLLLPAPLSPSGKGEACIQDLDAVLIHERNTLELISLKARCRDILLSASGALNLSSLRQQGGASRNPAERIPELLAVLKQLVALYPQIDKLGPARIELHLAPSDSRVALAEITAMADALNLDLPRPLRSGPVRLSTRIPLAGWSTTPLRIDARVASLETPELKLGETSALLRCTLKNAPFALEPRNLQLNTDFAEVYGQHCGPLSLRVDMEKAPRLRVDCRTSLLDTRIEARGSVDARDRTANLALRLKLTNTVVALASEKVKADLSRYVKFSSPADLQLDLQLGPGPVLRRADGWISADDFLIYKVPMDHLEGDLHWDGNHFESTRALARTGTSFARGSYEMDADTRDYRFLLEGQLQPMRISPWFTGWWGRFWDDFSFPKETPAANVDIRGCWVDGEKSRVHVGVDAANPVVRGVVFKQARTSIYVLPGVVYAPHIHAFREEGQVQGWFVHKTNPLTALWRAIEFDFKGQIDPLEISKIFPPDGPSLTAPYRFANTPNIHAKGWLLGPGSSDGEKQHIEIDLEAKGDFAYRGFPLLDLKCHALWDNQLVELSELSFGYAEGQASGRAKVDMSPDKRRLWFEGSLKNARFTEALKVVDTYIAGLEGRQVAPKPSLSKIAEARIDLNASAEGSFSNPFSFKGNGDAVVTGAELSQVRMFGLLSELLRFTTLRFTTAKARFNIEGNQLVFPELRLVGRNSAVDAHGTYSLEKQSLDFNAKVWPFQESQNIMQGAMGLVLSPLSHMLAVKLEGTVANPSWSFLISPFRTRTATELQENANGAGEGTGRPRGKP